MFPSSSPPRGQPGQSSQDRLRATAQALLPGFSAPGAKSKQNETGNAIAIYRDANQDFYPTPIPTSERGNLDQDTGSSSPPPAPARSEQILEENLQSKQHVQASESEIQQRALRPLVVVRVPKDGSSVLLGRSSQSCDYALRPNNKFASRVHAQLSYESERELVKIVCLGWNGLVVTVPEDNAAPANYDVVKDQSIYIEACDGISINIHGDRALVEFETGSSDSVDVTEDEYPSSPVVLEPEAPSGSANVTGELGELGELSGSVSPLQNSNSANGSLNSSPFAARLGSPLRSVTASVELSELSGSPISSRARQSLPVEMKQFEPLQSKETEKVESKVESKPESKPETNNLMHDIKTPNPETPPVETQTQTQTNESPEPTEPTDSTEQNKAKLIDESTELEDSEREVTPGPGGPGQAKIETTVTPRRVVKKRTRKTAKPRLYPPRSLKRAVSEDPEELPKDAKRLKAEEEEEIANIIVNQLAFSRLSTTPLSAVQSSTPRLHNIPKAELKRLIGSLRCVGVITAEGVDWVGRPLEPEYYYQAEKDTNEQRRLMVESASGHRSLRNCRKSTHKEFFYYTKQ